MQVNKVTAYQRTNRFVDFLGMDLLQIPSTNNLGEIMVEQVNGERPSGTMDIFDQTLTIAGWAIDTQNQNSAGWVVVEIDSIPYLANCRIPKKGVAKRLGNQFLYCGFRFDMPIDSIGEGTHTIKIKMLDAHSSGYCKNSFNFTINCYYLYE